jgi:uncharacterized protein with HEPN domain
MNKNLHKYLWDIKEQIELLEKIGTTFTLESFEKDQLIIHATERCFEIMGEALKRAMMTDENIAVTDKHKIIGMRNKIAHGYDDIEPNVLWGTIHNHIPILKEEINKLLPKV